jgi:RNA polymerase sigma-70 factor (ECF subfamily)
MESGSERELVRRMLGGDEAAFDEFFADYFPRLFRFAVLRLHDADAAEDLVQISLIAAVRNLASWRGEATLFTWLCTICRREIAAWEKRTSRRVSVALAEDDPGVRAAHE